METGLSVRTWVWTIALFLLLVFSSFHEAWPEEESLTTPSETPQQDPGAESDGIPKKPSHEEDGHSPDTHEVTFAVREYQAEGNTVLSMDKINETVSPYLGPQQRVSDVEKARSALEQAYRDAGYPTVLVAVPEQTIENEVVRLTVIESTLGAVKVVGNRYISTASILNDLPSLRPGKLLYEPVVLKELDGVNSHSDLAVTPILQVGSAPGTVDLQLKVNDRFPLHGNIEWNNRGTPNTPRQRLNASVQYTNFFGLDRVLSFQTTQTPQEGNKVRVYGLSYVTPLKWSGHLLALYAARSDSQAAMDGSTLPVFPGEISITGDATILGARYILSALSDQNTNYQISFGIDYKRLGESDASFPGPLGSALVSDQLNYSPLSISYTGQRLGGDGITKFSASLRGYIAGMVPGGAKEDFAGDPSDPLNHPPNRAGSTGTFAVLQAGIERRISLPQGFGLSMGLDGQWATEPLVSAEEYFAGGVDTVRGYVENEVLGDDATRARVEVTTPPLTKFFPSKIKENLWLMAFYDVAYLWVKDAPSGQKDYFQLGGTGFGLRYRLTNYTETRLDQAWALRDGIITQKGDSFTHLILRMNF
jgi:hemolysin activation/secretion protein